MKNKKVRLLALLLAGFVLVGCGKTTNSSDKAGAGESGQGGSKDVTTMVYDFEYIVDNDGTKFGGYTVKNISSDGMWSDNLTHMGTDSYTIDFKWSGPADFGANWVVDENGGISVASSNGTFEMILQAGAFTEQEVYLEQFTQDNMITTIRSNMLRTNLQQTPVSVVSENGYTKASCVCSTSEVQRGLAQENSNVINDSRSAFVVLGNDATKEVVVLQFIVKEYAYTEEIIDRFIESVSLCDEIKKPDNAQTAIEEVEFDRNYEYSSIDFIDNYFRVMELGNRYTTEIYKCIRTDDSSVTDCYIDIFNYDRPTMMYCEKEYLGTIKYSLRDAPRNLQMGTCIIQEDEEFLYEISLDNMRVTVEKNESDGEMTEAILKDKLKNRYSTEIQEDTYEYESDGEWASALYCYDSHDQSCVNVIKYHYETGYVFYVRYVVYTYDMVDEYIIKNTECPEVVKSLEFLLR